MSIPNLQKIWSYNNLPRSIAELEVEYGINIIHLENLSINSENCIIFSLGMSVI